MKALMFGLAALVLSAAPAFANITDSTYTAVPPVLSGKCPQIESTITIDDPCLYTVLGSFTDTYLFAVPADAVYSFATHGNHWHWCVTSGRPRPCYTESLTITNAVVVDTSTGNVVLQLTYTGSFTIEQYRPDTQDRWSGDVELPPGDYAFLISAAVSGNRPGAYGYSITF